MFWSLTAAFLPDGDGAATTAGFDGLVGLFEAWSARLAPLRGTAKVLHIAQAVEQLTSAMCTLSAGGHDPGLAQLNELEQTTAVAECAAQRFRQAHETLAAAVSQTIEAGVNTLSPDLAQARDAAFGELQEALQQLETCLTRIDLPAVQAAVNTRLAPLEGALAKLKELTEVELTAALAPDAPAGDGDGDADAVTQCCAMLRQTAGAIAQHVQKSAAAAQQLVDRFIARDQDGMLETASDLQNEICTLLALKSSGDGASIATVLESTTPWDVILRCAARLLSPLRAVGDKVGYIQTRAAALRVEVDAFASGLAARPHIVSRLEERHKTMKRVRRSYMRLRVDHDNSDDDSEEIDPKELARQRHVCRVATSSRDEAARELFLAAKAYHPETLVEQQKRLRLTGLSAIWSERTLDEYDERKALTQKGGACHAMVYAKYEGNACVLKLIQLRQGLSLCKEAEILRRLNHPNIVKLEAAFVESDFLYLHFPYAKHGDLEQYLDTQASMVSGGRIPPKHLCRMARQLCEAVAYLAERNIVHCDIKPANVFVDEEDNGSGAPIAILGDFDVSHTASGRTATLTMSLQTRGVATHYSAGYAAPEVVRAPPGQPPRTTSKLDVFGLGCVIYRMHMYPRALPEPETMNDEVAGRADLFSQDGTGGLPNCAVAAWAGAVPRDAIVSATRANPTARLSPRELLQTEYMRRADGDYARLAVQRPAHWQYQEHAGSWLVRESAETMAQVEKLLNDTAKPDTHGIGRDSHKIRFARFKVTSVHRVENSEIWSAYASRRRALADALAVEGYVLPESAQRLSTAAFQYPFEGGMLEAAAGEAFLFHGTSKPESIASSGFDVRYAYTGAGAGAMFGRGVYFAESASKSDHYVRPTAGGKLTLIVARVCLGRCQVVDHSRSNAHFLPEVEGKSTPAIPVYYDSILTEVPGMRFREMVVGRDASAYPELLVEYERV